jgi:prepilin-type N-terminal cleavage/methylation domain-containing protein
MRALNARTVYGDCPDFRRENGTVPFGRTANCQLPSANRFRRASFTLVELLVVIAIIGLLAAMLVGAVMTARTYVKRAAIRMEIEKLSQAMNAYREKYGEFPPSGDYSNTTVQTAVVQHLAKAFPRYAPTTFAQFVTDVKAGCGIDPTKLNASAALVFWLAGPPTAAGQKTFKGFSSNPFGPFDASQGQGPLFEFDVTRLVDNGAGWWAYSPPSGMNVPYVYFRPSGGSYDMATQFCSVKNPSGATETVKPYANPSTGNTPYNPTSFQIISAGLDGVFGIQGAAGNPQTTDSDDNIANFTFTTVEANQP